MAAPLRALVCAGAGNEVLQRLCKEMAADIPFVEVSSTGSPDLGDTVWTGNVPLESKNDGSTSKLPLNEWLDSPCISVDHEHERVVLTWKEFLPRIAEKRGYLHTDAAVPAYFAAIDSVVLMGLPVSDWLYRKAAGAVGRAAHEILRLSDVDNLPTAPAYDSPHGLVGGGGVFQGIFAATVAQSAYERRLDAAVRIAARGDAEPAVEELKKLVSETASFETLFYRRLRAKLELEWGNIEARRYRPAEAEQHWKTLVNEYWNSADTFLARVARTALSNISRLWR